MDEIKFFKFEDWQKEISRNKLTDPWITVFDFHKENNGYYATFCGLIPNEKELIKKVLSHFSWDITVEFGYPGFWKEGTKGSIRYERFENTSSEVPFEPLIIYRSFYGRWEEYVELSEEFRLYHNLYFDFKRNEFIFLSQSGEEDVAARIEKSSRGIKVQVKTKYLRDFLAAKSMVLVRFFEHDRFSEKDLTDKLGTEVTYIEKIGENFCFSISINPKPEILLDEKCFSRFNGKDIIPPFKEPQHESFKFLRGQKRKKYTDFIIGIDEEGNPIEYTCNPDKLSNFFGANPGAPNYLTPVFFRREVLRKYYEQPSKYSVEDGYIRCGYLWGMRYGQNPSGLVHAWLGDLGRDLPYNEQLHWKQFNVPPEGGLGEATIKRGLLAEFADPDEITHIFKYEFDKFTDYWRSKFGWDLFLPLKRDDRHYFKSLHVPTSEDPLEFEQQIQALAKILPDSINVSGLKKLINESEKVNGSINLLEKVLISHFGMDNISAKNLVEPLRVIQSIRSSSVAHRKGNTYEKTSGKLGLNEESNINFFKRLLEDVVKMLKQLQKVVEGYN